MSSPHKIPKERPGPVGGKRDQNRRERTAGLVSAGLQQFLERGIETVTIDEITREAGVAKGSFYRYFDDKKQLFLEVSRRHLAAGYERILEGLTPERFVGKARHATISTAIDVLCAHVAQYPAMERVFVEMSLRDPEVARLRRAFDDAGRTRLAALITAVTPRSRVPDPEATAWVLYTAAVECAAALSGLHGPPPVSPAAAKAALAAVLERALFA